MLRSILLVALALGACSAEGSRGVPGPQGERGPAGDVGARGEQGELGAMGAMGERGEPGPAGENGIEGDEGPRGAMGNPGAPGEAGPRGVAGPQGERGDAGPQGVMGTMGSPGEAGRFDLVDANDVRLGTLIAANLPNEWWVLTDDEVILGYNFFGGALRTLSLNGGATDLMYESTDCTGPAHAAVTVERAGTTNSGQLYRLVLPRQPALTIHSLRPAGGAACMESITAVRDVMAVELVGPIPADGAIPFRLVERP